MADIFEVGIVGSGIMGAGLAEVAARAGHDVVVRSRTMEGAEAVLTRITKGLDRQVSKERMTAEDRDAIVGRIRVTDHLGQLAHVSLAMFTQLVDHQQPSRMCQGLDDLRPSFVL